MSEPPPDDTIPRAVKAAIGLGVVFTVAALGLFGGRSAFSVAVGAGIGIANLIAMRAIIRNLLRPPADAEPDSSATGTSMQSTENGGSSASEEESSSPAPEKAEKPEKTAKTAEDHREAGKRGGVAWGVFAVLKMVLLFGSVAILLTRGMVDPMPLVVGYGVLPLGIALGSLWGSLRPNG